MVPAPLRVLVVDDNRSAADALVRILSRQGDSVAAAYDGATAIQRIQADPPDLVFTDLKMEPVDGLEVLKAARALRPAVEVVVFTAYSGVDVAVKAMRSGARDFLTKPVTVEQVSQRLEAVRAERAPPTTPAGDDAFIATSAAGQATLAALRQAATVPSPVWLSGEIGSGRGFAAATLHRLRASGGPMVARDLSRDEPWPTQGTCVLPAVDDLPEDLQASLHRSLVHAPPGVRLISTASGDGRQLMAEGRLSPKLYFALAVLEIQIPPLRQRPEDILPLFDQALDLFSQKYNRPRPLLTEPQAQQILSHAWPGNIRELRNLAERAVVMGPDALQIPAAEPAPAGMPSLGPGFDLSGYLDSVERRILAEALRRANGDRAQAGRILGVERNALRYKLNKHGLLDR